MSLAISGLLAEDDDVGDDGDDDDVESLGKDEYEY